MRYARIKNARNHLHGSADKAIRDTIYPNFGLGGEGTDSSFGDTDLSDVDFSNIDFGDLKLGDDFNPDDFLDDNGGQTDLGDTL